MYSTSRVFAVYPPHDFPKLPKGLIAAFSSLCDVWCCGFFSKIISFLEIGMFVRLADYVHFEFAFLTFPPVAVSKMFVLADFRY